MKPLISFIVIPHCGKVADPNLSFENMHSILLNKQVRKYRIDAYSWQTLNWIEAPELQIIGIHKTLQYQIDTDSWYLQDF